MELYKPPIILLTETWLTPALPDGLVSLENDSLFRNYRMYMKEDFSIFKICLAQFSGHSPIVR